MQPLNPKEINRYNRQIILPELGFEGQQKLRNAAVLMLGAGGLGCPILQYLAAAGIGKIGIVDFDDVDESNLHRQVLYNQNDIGKKKAQVAAEKLKFLNPHVEIEVFAVKFDKENAKEIIDTYDFLMDGSDNFTTRYLVNDICVAADKPWIFGSLFKFEGQVSVFNFQNGPTYRDVYPEAPDENSVPNCAEIGVIGVLPGIIGLLMANEAIKIICGIGENLSGKLLVFDALENIFNIYQLKAEKKAIKKIMPQETEISFEEFENLDKAYLIDIREAWEFEDFNKGGKNIPLSELPQELEHLIAENPIVFCCNYGHKSKIAVKLVQDKYPDKNVYSIKDGIEEC